MQAVTLLPALLTVILAMGAGKTAAAAMDEYIKSKNA